MNDDLATILFNGTVIGLMLFTVAVVVVILAGLYHSWYNGETHMDQPHNDI